MDLAKPGHLAGIHGSSLPGRALHLIMPGMERLRLN